MIDEQLLQRLHRLKDAILNSSISAKNVHFFYIDENISYYIKNDFFRMEGAAKEYYDIENLKFDRGEILSLFSKLEFLVNEILRLHFFGLSSKDDFDKLLEYIDLSRRVKTLSDLKIITSSISKKMGNTSYVRNQIAHVWNLNGIKYLEKRLQDEENMLRFKADMEEIFKAMIEAYHSQLIKNNFESYIDKLTLIYENK